MKSLGQGLFFVFQLLCYAALALVAAGFGALVLVSVLDVCPTLNEGGISCVAPTWERLAGFGMTVALLTVFTGIPGLFAIGGIVFLVRNMLRRSRGVASAERPAVSDTKPAQAARGASQETRQGIWVTALKVAGLVLGLFFLAGVMAGLYQSLTGS